MTPVPMRVKTDKSVNQTIDKKNITQYQIANENIPEFTKKPVYDFIKRISGFTLSLIILIVLAIPMVIISIAIKIDSKGPVIFKQPRIGRKGKVFTVYKFRSMYVTAPANCATYDLENADSQITKVGTFLRKTSLDEVPQFFNVLKGDMSIIGARPLIPDERNIHELRMMCHVYEVRPGLTGWAQINGRDNLSIEDKAKYDSFYVKNRSIGFDFKIFFYTIFKVLNHDGIKEGK